MENHIQNALLSITQGLEKRSDVSQARLEDFSTLLRALQHQAAGLPAQTCAVSNTSRLESSLLADASGSTRLDEENAKLIKSLERLRNLATQEEGTATEEEAAAIINDLECLLNAFSTSHRGGGLVKSGKRKAETNDTEEIIGREIKRLCRLVTASHSVEVNRGGKKRTFTLIINPV